MQVSKFKSTQRRHEWFIFVTCFKVTRRVNEYKEALCSLTKKENSCLGLKWLNEFLLIEFLNTEVMTENKAKKLRLKCIRN